MYVNVSSFFYHDIKLKVKVKTVVCVINLSRKVMINNLVYKTSPNLITVFMKKFKCA